MVSRRGQANRGVEAENPRVLDVVYRITDRLETLEILIGHPDAANCLRQSLLLIQPLARPRIRTMCAARPRRSSFPTGLQWRRHRVRGRGHS
jgi:hypothetical protein